MIEMNQDGDLILGDPVLVLPLGTAKKYPGSISTYSRTTVRLSSGRSAGSQIGGQVGSTPAT